MTLETSAAGDLVGDACAGDDRGRFPLVGLLGRAHALFVVEFEERLRAAGVDQLSLAHSSNVLRHLADGPRRASHLVTQCAVSKQAVSQQIAHLERNGYVAVCPDEADQRARLVALTAKGECAQELVRRLFTEVEEAWEARIGQADAAALRRALDAVLEADGDRDAGC
ncbi:MAG: MarR family winged helix-turn-helix transcriptional regulator [Janibacter sp.]